MRTLVTAILTVPLVATTICGQVDDPAHEPGLTPVAAQSLPDRPPIGPENPLRVSFRLADGVRVGGQLTGWNQEGVEGSFGRRGWNDIMAADVWKIASRLIDRESAVDWLLVARILVAHEQGADLVERALARSLRLDSTIQSQVDLIRAEAAAAREKREADRIAAEAERLRTLTPEAGPFQADPWRVLSPQEQEAAAKAMRDSAAEIMHRVGGTMNVIQSRHFLVYTDMERRAGAIWARTLDELYADTLEFLHVPPQTPLFHGLAVVFISSDRDQFKLIEADAFGYLTRGLQNGACHYRGPGVYINAYYDGSDDAFKASIMPAVIRGMLHRFRSPRRLPPWANDGLADYLAFKLGGAADLGKRRRKVGRSFVRQGGDIASFMGMDYGDSRWPGNNELGAATGFMLVELMIEQKPLGFVRWLYAVKNGAPWHTALPATFGSTPRELVQKFVQYTRVND